MNSLKRSDDGCESIAAINELRNEFRPSWKDPALKSQSAPADFCSRGLETHSPSHKPGHCSDVPCGESSGTAALLYISTC